MPEAATLPAVDSRPAAAGPSLLFVDDETNILNALRRLFRPAGYQIRVATSGADALAMLDEAHADLVISDMRMPNMSGADFLAQVRRRFPDTVRILLTGYADVTSTIAAINEGEIHRYIAKPWNDQEVLLVVREACERKALERERKRLEQLTKEQNAELKALNANLEAKVAERTAALQSAHTELASAHERLKTSFLNSIKVFSSLIELRAGAMAGHSRRVADHARRIAQALKLRGQEGQDIFLAALLHDIGKIALSDAVLCTPFNRLTTSERGEVMRHPLKGEAVLMGLEQLRGAAKLIRSHHERFDGQGYPDQLGGEAIPLGARILAVANDYDGLIHGGMFERRMSDAEARDFLRANKGKRYDPAVVEAFLGKGEEPASADAAHRFVQLSVDRLQPGMVLAKDLTTRDGVLLLARDFLLDEGLIAQIKAFEESEGYALKIAVLTDRR
jgi:response regulator RpfG family c-di-GMP phosphodiesterase